jgi:hypothetical protein
MAKSRRMPAWRRPSWLKLTTDIGSLLALWEWDSILVQREFIMRAHCASWPHPSLILASRCPLALLQWASNASSSSYGDVEGYIHDISDRKIPANPKSCRYFDFKLQEADGETRVVCIYAEQDEFKDKEQSRRPVCLSNVSWQKRTYTEGMEYKMNKYSRVAALPLRKIDSTITQNRHSQRSRGTTRSVF